VRITLRVVLVVLATGCGASGDPDPGGAQLAAAAEVSRAIAANPGPIRVICVAYSGDWPDPPLPGPMEGVSFAYGEGCEEVDGQLFSQSDRARAIWLGVGEPAAEGATSAEVRVYTSTGLDDAASYACKVGREGSTWVVEGCELEAVS
jgi:hypothetical protein